MIALTSERGTANGGNSPCWNPVSRVYKSSLSRSRLNAIATCLVGIRRYQLRANTDSWGSTLRPVRYQQQYGTASDGASLDLSTPLPVSSRCQLALIGCVVALRRHLR